MLSEAPVEATIPVSNLARAREFYEGTLGLRAAGSHSPDAGVVFECGAGTRLFLYERAGPGAFAAPPHTVAHFQVGDVAAAVRVFRGTGVAFDEYDLENLKTVDGVATIGGDRHIAWFKDPAT